MAVDSKLEGHGEAAHADHGVPVFIDDVKYSAPSRNMSGEELRSLPVPPLGPDRDLWLEVPGPSDDVLVRAGESYDVKPGSHYYTAPSTINPGAVHGASA